MVDEHAGTANNHISIIYEDNDLVVINKPASLIVHTDGVTAEGTVVEWLLEHAPMARGIGDVAHGQDGTPLERSGIVHRLDRDTSGVLVLAKTAAAHMHLKAQFQNRTVKKEYRAFVYGRLNDRWGTINRPIGRSPRDHRMWSAQPGAKGVMREAITDFERIGEGEYEGESFSYVKLFPKTGRTHQLRVHLKAIDRPIVGDPIYAAHLQDRSNHLGMNRLALHAHALEFELPGGETERFIAPVPADFERAAERLEGESVS